METAIRNALSRVENPDETQRARIYQTARDALVRNLESRGITDPDEVRPQISRLKDLIVRIEADYDGQAPMAAPAAQAALERPTPPLSPAPVAPPVVATTAPAGTAPDIRMDRDRAPSGNQPGPAFGPDMGFSPGAERAQPTGRAQDIQVTRESAPGEHTPPAPRVEPRIDAPNQTGPQSASQPPQQSSRPSGNSAFPTLEGERREHGGPPSAPAPRPENAGATADATLRTPAADDGLTLPPPRETDETRRKGGLFSKRDRKAESGKPEPKKKRRRERHVFASAFSSLVLLSFLGIGVWWLIDSGAFDADWDTSVPNPPPNVSSEDYSGEGSAPRPLNPESGFSGAWTTIYAPRSGDPLSTGSLASAAITDTETGPVLTITSADGGDDGEVSLPISASALQEMAGRPSVMAITVRAATDETTPFYIKCDFGTLGDCGRRRFNAESQPTDALIELDFSRQMAPSASGTISINSDITGIGRPIQIFAIRIRPAN